MLRVFGMIEKMSQYKQAESLEFLRKLVKEGVFETEEKDGL